LKKVRRDLQKAIEVELFTLPPYLTALYSIHENTNEVGCHVIQSVAMEEMLHIILVANVMNAVGAKPALYTNVQKCYYPSKIPHIATKHDPISLLPFSKEAIKKFMDIEEPDFDASKDPHPDQPDTIGEFYDQIKRALIRLCPNVGEEKKIFSGDPALQISPNHYYYGAGGKTVAVHNLATALEALEEIAEQGEGRKDVSNLSGNKAKFGQPKEPAHYYRFQQLLEGRRFIEDGNIDHGPQGEKIGVDYSRVYPMQDNPTPKKIRPKNTAADFEKCYSSLLKNLEVGLNGNSSALNLAITDMHALHHHVVSLMRTPIRNSEKTLGAPFWFVKKEGR